MDEELVRLLSDIDLKLNVKLANLHISAEDKTKFQHEIETIKDRVTRYLKEQSDRFESFKSEIRREVDNLKKRIDALK